MTIWSNHHYNDNSEDQNFYIKYNLNLWLSSGAINNFSKLTRINWITVWVNDMSYWWTNKRHFNELESIW
jgi:hypothetical protein